MGSARPAQASIDRLSAAVAKAIAVEGQSRAAN
jgi:hypothetical protein